MNGIIFDLKRVSVQEGTQLQSTLFLKGCPLRCPWCQNPEGLRRSIRLWHQPSLCIQCGQCVLACPNEALRMDTRVHIDQSHCKVCTTCVDACSTGALGLEGREITAAEAVSELLQDASLYSNGCRVILSGGEVLAQPEFALEVLRLCKKASADTAIESCLYASWETIERFLPLVDEFFVYIKYLNPQIHKAVTGVDNERILDNYIRLVRVKANVTVRTLLVPGYTAAKGNIRAIARFIANNDPAAKYELVRFNSQCRVKYAALERVYPVKDIHLSENEIARYYEILRREGIRQIIREVPCESSSAVSS